MIRIDIAGSQINRPIRYTDQTDVDRCLATIRALYCWQCFLVFTQSSNVDHQTIGMKDTTALHGNLLHAISELLRILTNRALHG